MPTQSVNLSKQQAAFIRQAIGHGRFRSPSEVVRAGLRLLEHEEEQNKLKLDYLRRQISEGFAAIDRGEYEAITHDSLREFLDSVSATNRRGKSA